MLTITYKLILILSTLLIPSTEKEDNTIRVMSYNIRNAKGLDNVTDYQRIADIILQYEADFIAIQEIDSATTRNGGLFVLEEIAERCKMNFIFSPAINFQGGKYGVGILSKHNPLSVKHIPLPGREEARILLIAEFAEFYIASTHLSLTPEDQEESAKIIISELEKINEIPIGKPLILAGDMNCEPGSAPQLILNTNLHTLSNPLNSTPNKSTDKIYNTFPADNPDRCIDYIYGTESLYMYYEIIKYGVINEPLASDHRPIYIDIRRIRR